MRAEACSYQLPPGACGAGLGQDLAGRSPDPPPRPSRECVQTGETVLLGWRKMFWVLTGAWVVQVHLFKCKICAFDYM